MLDIKFVRENPDIVKENIRKKFEDQKLPLVDEVIDLDRQNREIKQELQALQADRNRISKEIGKLMHAKGIIGNIHINAVFFTEHVKKALIVATGSQACSLTLINNTLGVICMGVANKDHFFAI